MHLVCRFIVFLILVLPWATDALAIDGIILIDQNKALAGNVTPGDAPGFPVTITQSGSYRLSGNLRVPDENTTAVVITASDVVLDLNGFGIYGPGRPQTVNDDQQGAGVLAIGTAGFSNAPSHITVRNGTVAAMGSHGIILFGNDHIVRDMHSHNNHAFGIHTTSAMIMDNMVTDNGQGIAMSFSGIVRNNVVRGPGDGGVIVVFCPSSIVGNSATTIFEGGNTGSCARDQNTPAP